MLTVLGVELDRRAVGNLAEPHVQILALARLEEHDIVAVVELGKLVQLVKLGLGIELDVFAAVGEHRCEIVEEMSVSVLGAQRQLAIDPSFFHFAGMQGLYVPVGNASGRENQNSLLVLPEAAIGGDVVVVLRVLGLLGALRERLVNGGHFPFVLVVLWVSKSGEGQG